MYQFFVQKNYVQNKQKKPKPKQSQLSQKCCKHQICPSSKLVGPAISFSGAYH